MCALELDPARRADGSRSSWRREDIERFLDTERLTYQKIRLPHGLSTPGIERPDICAVAFGESMRGKTVFDVGSHLGYYCLEALERGAAEAIGIDVDPDHIALAGTLAEIKGLTPTYLENDIESYEPAERFDVVLCLNMLHHVFDPIAVLHKLSRMTREKLVLEVAGFGRHDGSKNGLSRRFRRMLSRLPVMYVGRGAAITRRPVQSQKFFLSAEAVTHILDGHTKVFANVEIVPSSFKGRLIVSATRRRIDRLLVVSGPTSSGKSAFMEHLSRGSLPGDVRAKLPDAAEGWPQIGANGLFQSPVRSNDGRPLGEHLEGLVLHYDFLRPRLSGTHNYARDRALDLLDCAREVSVVVLRPDTGQLVDQLIRSELGGNRERTTTPRNNASGPSILERSIAAVPKPVRRTLGRVPLVRTLASKLRGDGERAYGEELLASYEREGWLGNWYERWTGYLAERHPAATVLDVTMPVETRDQGLS